MEFLPKTLGTRPRLACEIRPEGLVAARAEDASAILSAVAQTSLAHGVAVPQVRSGLTQAQPVAAGSAALAIGAEDRAELVAALRRVLEAVALRSYDVTLVVPDAAVRVLLLDFDMLPSKVDDALPVVRFRLKKLLPFDSDDAAVSYQVMSSSKSGVQVLAIAMPRDVLAEYESMVREAGFEPGAILPSTLAALAALPEDNGPTLVVNASSHSVTTAILEANNLRLHRSIELGVDEAALPEPANRGESEYGYDDSYRDGQVSDAIALEAAAEQRMALAADEIAQTVSRTIAYFEDTLAREPRAILASGTLGARALDEILNGSNSGLLTVEEIVQEDMIGPGAVGSASRIPNGWLAGVRGALAN